MITENFPLLPELPAGYRALGRLGCGAFGEVWRAEAPGGVEVAVKIIPLTLRPDEAERELEALQLIKRLRHPYLLSLQAYFAREDSLVIVLELADRSLRERREECRAAGQDGIPPAELLPYIGEAAEALDYLHSHNILHRDIKPDNILLIGRHAKVADCGVARLLERHSLHDASTVGTPSCMPPEVWKGQVTIHSDQYSLAVTYADLRLGRPPFPAVSISQLMQHHLHTPPDLAPLGAAEQQVLRKALAKAPEERFPSCGDFVQALTTAVAADARTGPGKADDVIVSAGAAGRPHSEDRPPSPRRLAGAELSTLKGKADTAPAREQSVADSTAALSVTTKGPAGSHPDTSAPTERPRGGRRVAALLVACLVAGGIGLLVWQVWPLLLPAPDGARPVSAERIVETLPAEILPVPKEDGPTAPPKPKPPQPVLALVAAAALTLEPGGAAVLEVRVKREHCHGPVRLSLSGLPAAVRALPATLAADQDTIRINLEAADTAQDGVHDVTLRAELGALEAQRRVRVTVAEVPSLKLLPPADVTVQPGQTRSFGVRVVRRACPGPVELRVENLPPGVTAPRGNIPAARDSSGLAVTVGKTAEPATRRVHVTAVAGGRRAESAFTLTIVPPKSWQQRLVEDGDAIDRAPKNPIPRQNRGHTYRELGEYDKAIAEYDAAIRLDPGYAPAFNSRGNARLDKKYYDEALDDYAECLRLDPTCAVALNNRGQVHRRRKEYDRAIAEYDAAIRLDPQLLLPRLNRAYTYLEMREFGKAIEDYTGAIDVDPGSALALAGRGNAYRLQGESGKALEDCDRAIRLDRKLPYAHNMRGLIHLAKKEQGKAIGDFDEAIRLDGGYAAAYGNRGNARYTLGEYVAAIEDFRAAGRLDSSVRSPNHALAHHKLGSTHYRNGDRAAALKDFDEAIRLNPRLAVAYIDRARVYHERGEYDRVIKDCSAALDISPKSTAAYNNRGNAWSAKKEYDRAIEDYDAALRIAPSYYLPYYNRANAYRRKKDPERAIKDYTAAIRINAQYTPAFRERGLLYLEKGENDRAIEDFDAAIKLNGKDAFSWNDRGVAYGRKKDYKQAIQSYTKAIQFKGDYALAYANRARAYGAMGNLAKAREDRAAAIRLDPAWAKTLPSFER